MKNSSRLVLVLAIVFVSTSFAQQDGSLPSSLTSPQQVDTDSQDTGQSLGELARHARKDHSEETKLSAEDAKKLFSEVDRISAFASQDSEMPLHGPVKRRIISRDDLEKTAREHMSKNKDYSESFARAELTMKKFGLLPRSFDLKEFMIKVSRKDIAGYYDEETKTISLLNTVPLEQQEAILAHELTHALQDQNYDLKVWSKAGEPLDPKGKTGDASESRAARRAVVEGQAMVVFADYLLAPSGRSLLNSPGLIYRMEDPAVKAAHDSQLLHDAPIIVRATGSLPYDSGLIFEGELLQAGGKKMAFAGAFAHPPRNTHEVMEPRAYLEHEKPVTLPFPDAQALLGDSYELYDSGSVGELDVRALLWQLGTRTLADDLSKSWQGGAYMSFRKKTAATPTVGDLKLFYVSKWKSDVAAQRFAKFYVDSIARRYQSVTVNAAASCVGSECPKASTVVDTEEGPVIVELWKDDTVLVSESFDQETAAKLSSATRAVGHKTVADSSLNGELGMRLYDLPAFRQLQEHVGEEIFTRLLSQQK